MNAIPVLIKSAEYAGNPGEFWQNVKAFMQDKWKPMTAVALGITIPAVGKYFLDKAIEDVVKDPGFAVKNTNSIINKAKAKAGIADIPHRTFDNFENAIFIPGGLIKEERMGGIRKTIREKLSSKNKATREAGKMLSTIADYSNNPQGGIIVGKKFKNPMVVAHELGHGMISRSGGVYGFMQKYGPIIQNIGTASSFGSAIPFLLGKPEIGNPMMYGGLGLAALGTAAEIAYEREATARGRKLLDDVKIKDEARRLGNKALDLAWGTYWTKALGKTLPIIGAGLV